MFSVYLFDDYMVGVQQLLIFKTFEIIAILVHYVHLESVLLLNIYGSFKCSYWFNENQIMYTCY